MVTSLANATSTTITNSTTTTASVTTTTSTVPPPPFAGTVESLAITTLVLAVIAIVGLIVFKLKLAK